MGATKLIRRLRRAVRRSAPVRYYWRYRYSRRLGSYSQVPVRSVAVCYYIPLDSPKIDNWKDGFIQGLEELHRVFERVDLLNFAQRLPGRVELDAYDFVLAKSAFQWSVTDHLYRVGLSTRRGICVSGHSVAIPYFQLYFFDVVFYETETYRPHVAAHPCTVHAYGISTEEMYPPLEAVPKTIDYLAVGILREYKHFTDLTGLTGRRVVVGECIDATGERIRAELAADSIEWRPYVGSASLRRLYWSAAAVVISSELEGGGERVLLEARQCGTPVLLTRSNTKLEELLAGPVLNGAYYGRQLIHGIQQGCD